MSWRRWRVARSRALASHARRSPLSGPPQLASVAAGDWRLQGRAGFDERGRKLRGLARGDGKRSSLRRRRTRRIAPAHVAATSSCSCRLVGNSLPQPKATDRTIQNAKKADRDPRLMRPVCSLITGADRLNTFPPRSKTKWLCVATNANADRKRPRITFGCDVAAILKPASACIALMSPCRKSFGFARDVRAKSDRARSDHV